MKMLFLYAFPIVFSLLFAVLNTIKKREEMNESGDKRRNKINVLKNVFVFHLKSARFHWCTNKHTHISTHARTRAHTREVCNKASITIHSYKKQICPRSQRQLIKQKLVWTHMQTHRYSVLQNHILVFITILNHV